MSDSYVTSMATLKCSCGDKNSKLTVYPDRTVFLTEKPMANISDHVSLYNIAPFGKCHTTRYPSTGAATAANKGKLTPMPCVPGTVSDWLNGKDDYIIKGKPALLKSSYCRCQWGGVITITDDGQEDTGSADLSREQVKTEEEMKAESEKMQELEPESVLDGIQLALDAAGLLPGVGAIPDLLNASISALRGDWGAAGLSVLAAVPLIGDAATAAKFAQKGVKAAKAAKKTGQQITKDQLKSSVANKGLTSTNNTSNGTIDLSAYREAKMQKEMQKSSAKSKEKLRVIEGGKQESVSIKKAVGQNDNTIYNSVVRVNGYSSNYSYSVKPVEKVVPVQSNRSVAKGVERDLNDIKKENQNILDFKSKQSKSGTIKGNKNNLDIMG